MTWLTPTLVFVAAWIALFLQTGLEPVRILLGAPPTILPALVVYAAFTQGLGIVCLLTFAAGLGSDALSGSQLGSGVPPLLALGFFLNTRQHLLLREQRYAQFWLGLGGGLFCPLLHAALLSMGGQEPAFGWFTVRQVLGLGLLNGLACPVVFLFFERMRDVFEYQPSGPGPYSTNREMKRGRT